MTGLSKIVKTLFLAGAIWLGGQVTPGYGQEIAKAETGTEQTVKHDHSAKFYETNYSSKGIKNLESELKDHPTSQGYVRLSDLYFEVKQGQKAVRASKEAISLNPNDWQGYHNVGAYFLDIGNLTDAESYFKKAIRFAPQSAISHSCLSVVYANQKRLNEALSEVNLALSMDPSDPNSINTKNSVLKDLANK
ncbi:MAG: tetratricopeptide repeat protein [Nanoarchaeota archaeon]